MVENPRGYGKSSLVKEFASRYHGPVLFTDFLSVGEPAIVTSLMEDTIGDLFFDPYPLTIYAGKFIHLPLILFHIYS